MEIALTEGVDVESNKFSISIATTDVRDCFHRFRMPLSLSGFFFLWAVPAHEPCHDGRDARGTEIGNAAIWPCW